MNDRDLKRALQAHFDENRPEPDEAAKAAALALVAAAAADEADAHALASPGDARAGAFVSVTRFVMGQVRFVSGRVWAAQAALLAAAFAVCAWYRAGLEAAPAIAAIAALTVAVGLPELLKSSDHGMAELEYACRFDCRHTVLARFVILGLSDIVMLTCAMLAAPALGTLQPADVFLFACIPYFASCAGCLWIVNHTRGRIGTQLCVTLTASAALAAMLLWQALPKLYLSVSLWVWIALFCIVVTATFSQARSYLRRVEFGLDHLQHQPNAR